MADTVLIEASYSRLCAYCMRLAFVLNLLMFANEV